MVERKNRLTGQNLGPASGGAEFLADADDALLKAIGSVASGVNSLPDPYGTLMDAAPGNKWDPSLGVAQRLGDLKPVRSGLDALQKLPGVLGGSGTLQNLPGQLGGGDSSQNPLWQLLNAPSNALGAIDTRLFGDYPGGDTNQIAAGGDFRPNRSDIPLSSLAGGAYGPQIGESSSVTAEERAAHNQRIQLEDLRRAAEQRYDNGSVSRPDGQFEVAPPKDPNDFEWWDSDRGIMGNLLQGANNLLDAPSDILEAADRKLFGEYPQAPFTESYVPSQFGLVEGSATNPGGRNSPEWAAAMAAIGPERYAAEQERGRQEKIRQVAEQGPSEGQPQAFDMELFQALFPGAAGAGGGGGSAMGLAEQQAATNRGYARDRYGDMKTYLGAERERAGGQFDSDEEAIIGQLLQQDQERRDAEGWYEAKRTAEFEETERKLDARTSAASTRLNNLGIDPTKYTEMVGTEMGALLGAQMQSASDLAHRMSMLGAERARLGMGRAKSGFAKERRQFDADASDMLFQGSQRLSYELQDINNALMNRRITGAEAKDAANAAAHEAQMQAQRAMHFGTSQLGMDPMAAAMTSSIPGSMNKMIEAAPTGRTITITEGMLPPEWNALIGEELSIENWAKIIQTLKTQSETLNN